MRLNAMQKAEILTKLNGGVNGNRLAKEYGVAESTISLLKKSKFDDMLERNESFNQASSMSRSGNGSIQTEDTSNESDDDERAEMKPRIFPKFNQFKLYKSSQNIDENHHDDEDDDEEEESKEEEEDPNEICRKLWCICDNLHVPTQTLRTMFKLISKLRSYDCIE